jgi:hypothetical protein
MGQLRHVTIIVNNGIVIVVPDPVHIGKKDLGEVCWHSPQGEASINFADSPFYSDHFLVPRCGSCATGPVANDKGKGDYKYSIIVRVPGDRREYVVDPTVIVEDD